MDDWQKHCKRTYLPEPNDLDGYLDYHLIVRIIRFQIDQQIFEVVIPRDEDEYQVSSQFWLKLMARDCANILQLPKDTQFIVRRKAK